MTSYFSTSVPDMVESYSAQTYWVAFGIISSLSFFGLFFFSRLLMFFTEALEDFALRAFCRLRRSLGMRPGDDENGDG